jgi:hypothetical protein
MTGRETPPTTWPTIGQASRALGVSPQRVRELIERGKLRAKRGALGYRFIDPISLEKRLAERREAGQRQAERTREKTPVIAGR